MVLVASEQKLLMMRPYQVYAVKAIVDSIAQDCGNGYSKRVSLERIAEEGYNLNISRYISTAGEELEIDLVDAHADLVDIEKRVHEATAKHNTFLQELGLPPLPLSDG